MTLTKRIQLLDRRIKLLWREAFPNPINRRQRRANQSILQKISKQVANREILQKRLEETTI